MFGSTSSDTFFQVEYFRPEEILLKKDISEKVGSALFYKRKLICQSANPNKFGALHKRDILKLLIAIKGMEESNCTSENFSPELRAFEGLKLRLYNNFLSFYYCLKNGSFQYI